jgi:AcrR family transcriptional regulator
VSERHPTARRIITEALRLFAERGIAGTPIVRIEKAAGLAPSSGAFYRHFASKEEVLEAAVDDAAAASALAVDAFAVLDELPLEQQVLFIARGTWMLFDSQRDLMLVLTRGAAPPPSNYSHDADNFPGNGVAFLARWLTRRSRGRGRVLKRVADPEATALVLLDALTFFWMQKEGEAPAPYGVDPERFIKAWSNLVLQLAA